MIMLQIGKVIINEVEHVVGKGDGVVIPAGAKHNVINASATQELTLYTVYSPPHHKDGIIRKTKRQAVLHEEVFDGEYSEKLR